MRSNRSVQALMLDLLLTACATSARSVESDGEATFDKIFDQAMHMADALSDGIIKQFPNRF